MKRMICYAALICFLCGCQTASPAVPPSTGTTIPPSTETASPTATTPTESAQVPTKDATSVIETAFDPYAIVDTMSTEELVGQLFLVRCPSDESALSLIETYHPGGYILFGRDFENKTPNTVRDTIAGYQDASNLPMLIAVDEEGGTVTRVSSSPAFRSSRFPSSRTLFAEGGLELVAQTEEEKCQLLCSLGINVNLAPVCDITTDPDSFMYSRSLGQDPDVTGQFVAEVVTVMAKYKVGSVLKHFPGYGNNTDTHVGIAMDDRSLESLQAVDLVPFSAGIQAGCNAIMVSHTFVNCLDDQVPASISPAVIGYLRQAMGFDGVVVTDDLSMQAITDLYGTGDAAVLAVQAGCDLLCSSEFPAQYQAVLEAVNAGSISIDQIKTSAARILRWKYALDLLTDCY